MQEKLLLLRKETNTTQQELADLLHISVKTYGYKETGKSEFSMNEMFALSKYFKKTVEEIFLPRILQNGVKKNFEET